jgi:hypothetical protein
VQATRLILDQSLYYRVQFLLFNVNVASFCFKAQVLRHFVYNAREKGAASTMTPVGIISEAFFVKTSKLLNLCFNLNMALV